MKIYYCRHAEPIYSPDSLTEKGHLQAKALAERLKKVNFSHIYTSPSNRARLTAQATCDAVGLQYSVEDWTLELWDDFAVTKEDGKKMFCMSINGVKFREDIKTSLGDEWHTLPCLSTIDGKAAYEKVIRNSDSFLARHGYEREGSVYRITRENDENIAMFAHGGFGLVWLAHILAVPLPIFWAGFDINHASLTVINFKNDPSGYTTPKLKCFSDTSHLFGNESLHSDSLDF
ncbi:MAG: histidine phosphatase family protein [Clostridiales bacterium]|nr:histidine phosphatase family protein [Clostridiales bacterium]